jgi:hypothetical protein
MKKWLIMRDGKCVCVTTIPYPPDVEKSIKRAGYKIKIVEETVNGNDYKHKK